VLSPGHDPVRALRERATQNALAGLGYPVPRVLLASADRGPLGAGFLVMERAAGRPLLASRRPGIGRMLGEAHAWLHALNAEALLRALDDEGRAASWRFDRDAVNFESHLASLDRRIQAAGLDGLADGMRWLRTRHPAERSARVICHGDFHPQNLSRRTGGRPRCSTGQHAGGRAEYDVADLVISPRRRSPLPVPTALRPLALRGDGLAARYLAVYRKLRPFDRRGCRTSGGRVRAGARRGGAGDGGVRRPA
jgi:aminoglycoside/choline kinase family phosphotransferase